MVHNQIPGEAKPGGPAGRPALPIIGAILTAILVGAVLAVAACGGGNKNDDPKVVIQDKPNAGLADTAEMPTPEATIDISRTPVVPVTNPNLTKLGANDRIIISRFGIDAPLQLKQVASDGQMPDPDGSDEVVLYDFTAWPGLGGGPGTGGNAVLAGHVDSGRKACKNGKVPPPCQAVFWDVNKLKVGDEIEMKVDGQTYKYAVKGNQAVPAASKEWDAIVSTTAEETITLITCGGTFSNGEYNNRQVVTAARIKT